MSCGRDGQTLDHVPRILLLIFDRVNISSNQIGQAFIEISMNRVLHFLILKPGRVISPQGNQASSLGCMLAGLQHDRVGQGCFKGTIVYGQRIPTITSEYDLGEIDMLALEPGFSTHGKALRALLPRVIWSSSLARRVSRNIAIPVVHATRNTRPQQLSTWLRMPFDLLVPTPYSPPRLSLPSAHTSDAGDQTSSHSIRLSRYSVQHGHRPAGAHY